MRLKTREVEHPLLMAVFVKSLGFVRKSGIAAHLEN
jgi:hypothetical protein